jgi:hypothetical protein
MHLPSVRITRKFSDGKNQTIDVGQDELQGKYMDQYKKIVGDGLAKVTVSADMSLKEYGNGASAMVSVSLTCNQDKETIETAIDIAGFIAREYCVEQQRWAEKDLAKSRQLPPGSTHGS